MCVNKLRGAHKRASTQHPAQDAADRLISLMTDLPVADRSSCALGLASRLIEYAAFEMAGNYSADDVADLIDCAARLDHTSSDVQTATSKEIPRSANRMQ